MRPRKKNTGIANARTSSRRFRRETSAHIAPSENRKPRMVVGRSKIEDSSEALRFGERERIRGRLARRPIADLPAADVRRDLFGEARGIERPESRAPGVPEDCHLGLTQARAHSVHKLVQIGDELLHRKRRSSDRAVERLAGAALIPVDDGEALLKRRIEVTEQNRLAQPWPAVQQDQRWVRDAPATDHHPLIEPTEPAIRDLSDAAGQALAMRPTERRRLSEHPHASAPTLLAPQLGGRLDQSTVRITDLGASLALSQRAICRRPAAGKQQGRLQGEGAL